MADDNADDVKDAEITPDDFDGKQETPKAEPSPAKEAKAEPEAKVEAKADAEAEDKKPEAKETKEPEKAEPTKVDTPDVPTKADKEGDEEAPAEPDADKPAEDKPMTKADERKTQLNTEIRDLVSQRNAIKAEIEKKNAEVYQPAAEDELTDQTNPDTGQPYTSVEAKVEALRQEREMEKYNSQVADAQLTISSESERVLNDFPMFNSESESYDKELAEEAAELLQANLIYDQNTGQVIGSNVSPYQLYKTLARASGISATKGQIKGQQATEKMLANADTNTSTAPEKKPADPLTEMWAEPL